MHMKYEKRRDRPHSVIAAVLVVVVVVVLVAIVLLLALDRDDAPGPSTNPEPGAGSQTSSSVCGLADGDQTVPARGPEATWIVQDGSPVPSSPVFGPGKRVGGVAQCFGHNPSGALFAAANFTADLMRADADKTQLLARFFTDENKDLAQQSLEQRPSSGSPSYGLAIEAFRINDYTPQRTTLELVFRSTEGPNAGQRAATTVTLGWEGADWRVVAPATGKYATTALTSLTGYTTWGGG